MKKNAMTVVKYATTYPFRLPEVDVMCVLCTRSFEDPKDLRDHFDNDHKHFNVKQVFAHTTKLKVDCTDLSCRICDEAFDAIDAVADHLKSVHNKEISSDGTALEMFKFGPDKWACAYCQKKFISLRMLSRHTASHFRNFVCPFCGKGYTYVSDLKKHTLAIHSNKFRCVKCNKDFLSVEERNKHRKMSQACWHYKCQYCSERFTCQSIKDSHLELVHGRAHRAFKCPSCPLEFTSYALANKHYVIGHTEKFVCALCGKKFGSPKALRIHNDRHAGHLAFKCDVCDKAFLRKCQLVQHYWAHREDKRFECTLCKKKFNQRVSWKGHMKSRHPELVNF